MKTVNEILATTPTSQGQTGSGSTTLKSESNDLKNSSRSIDGISQRGSLMRPSEIRVALSAPFDPSEEKQRKGPGGKMLTYIDARAVMNRLDDVVGMGQWQTHFKEVNGVVVCELSIYAQMDNGEGIWITKSDGAGETDIEGEKGQFSDAFKRAAVHFGIGRYLYAGAPKREKAPPLSTYDMSRIDHPPNQDFDEAEMQMRKLLNDLEDNRIELSLAQEERDQILLTMSPEEKSQFWFERFKSGERTLLKKIGMAW